MEFIKLSYRENLGDLAKQLPPGKWTIICDEDAAMVGAPCWWAGKGEHEDVVKKYEQSGGTVSTSWEVDG
jgi:hypothetical protein